MRSIEVFHNALASIAAVVEQEGELHGRVRLQKLGYLLQQSGFMPLRHIRFSYHHYGPFSEQLAGALDQAVASGLLHEQRRDSPNGYKYYVYVINPEHPDASDLALPRPDADAVRSFVKASKDAHWRTLELGATVVYLQRNRNLDRETAIARALRLKPDCKPHRDDAEALLVKLGLASAEASRPQVAQPSG